MQNLKLNVTLSGSCVTLTWPETAPWTIANFWLRDNCHCPVCRHAGNGQKLYEIAGLPQDLSVREAAVADDAALRVLWSDGHQSTYSADWLAGHDLSPTARSSRAGKVKLWRSGIGADMPCADWPALLTDTTLELAWLERYAELGFGVLNNVARKPGMVAQVGDRLGFVRVTNYGRLFDVMSVPNPTNLAYTAVGLGVHSDNPYRHPSPGRPVAHAAHDLPLFRRQHRAGGAPDVDLDRRRRRGACGAFQQPLRRLAGCAGRTGGRLVRRVCAVRANSEAARTGVDFSTQAGRLRGDAKRPYLAWPYRFRPESGPPPFAGLLH